MLIRCFGPRFSEMELPPQLPQPKVKDGGRLKLYRSPMPPCDAGVLIKMRAVFMARPKLAMRSGCKS